MDRISVINLRRNSVNPTRIRRAIRKTLLLEGKKRTVSITVCFLNDHAIRKLNRRHLKHNCPTDVIAFSYKDKSGRLQADIAVSVDTALRNSRAYGTTAEYELNLYAVHGVLHILGYNDKTLKQRKIMQQKAERVLK